MSSQPDVRTFLPASVVLKEMHEAAPADHFTLDWVMGGLHKKSFGFLMLLLAVASLVPGIGLVAGPLLMIPAFQMIVGRPAPSFPRWISTRTLPARGLGAVVQRTIPVLTYVEKTIHPRWPTPPAATKCVVGIVVMMLTARLLLSLIPLSNVLPAVVIALISLAYLEEDGLLLSIGLLAGFIMVAVDLELVWEIVHGARKIGCLW